MSRTKARPSRARFDLDAIRHANPLPDLAANLTVLKQRGSEWIGCCLSSGPHAQFHHLACPG
jgi:hypothetical protein